MATTKPRITVTLNEDDAALLCEFANLQGCSQSSVLADLWADAAPVVRRVVDLMKEASAVKGQISDRVRGLAQEAELQMVPHAKSLYETFDLFDRELRQALAGGGGAADAQAAAGPGPAAPGLPGGARKE